MNLLERVGIIAAGLVLLVGALGSFVLLMKTTTSEIPLQGGHHTEGIIGAPRFINPLFATTNADRDLSEIVYAGLVMKVNGEYIPELAENFIVSDDGTTYTFTLKNNLTFHDGHAITADDVLFTVAKIQDGTVKSPLRDEWLGINVESPDPTLVIFHLDAPYAGFLDLATLGIIPQHKWQTFTGDQFSTNEENIHPIGSGPYRIVSVKRNNAGIPVRIVLKRFKNYTLGNPYLEKITFRFYANEQDLVGAFKRGAVDAISTIPPRIATELVEKKSATVEHAPLPRVFGLFFNTTEAPLFLDPSFGDALDVIIPRKAIIKHALFDYGVPLCGPFPPGMNGYKICEEPLTTEDARIARAVEILEKGGWNYNGATRTLTKAGITPAFSIATADIPELTETAELIKEALAPLGITVTIKIFESGNLDQEVIRPRNYEVLLFGELYEHDTDAYAFWHSKNRTNPGLNVSLYTNATVDEALERSLHTNSSEDRERLYTIVHNAITKDRPAIFLYSPEFLYVFKNKRHAVTSPTALTRNEDRLRTVHKWYRYTDRVWKN